MSRRPERRNDARDFEAEQVGGAFGRRVETLALQHVGPVDAGGFDLDQDLARARLRAPAARAGTSTSGPPGARRLDDGHGLWQHQDL